MDTKLVIDELIKIKDICQSSKTLDDAINQTDLLIFPENGYSILSYEFVNYLNNKYSQEFSLSELHSLLPSIVEKLGTHIEPMKTVNNLSFHCYKIFLT